jgi:uncharacterized protein YyaL (SSP411 family)
MTQSSKEIETLIGKLQAKRWKAKHEEWLRNECPKLLAMRGKVYKYRNSYSCPEKPSDYWWSYTIVDRVIQPTERVMCWTFQIDSDKNVRINYQDLGAAILHMDYRLARKSDARRVLARIRMYIDEIHTSLATEATHDTED